MTAESIPWFIGTDERMLRAERVIEHSARKAGPDDDLAITWMRAGDQDWKVSADGRDGAWNLGRKPSLGPYSGHGAATMFTPFRWSIPALCGFEGRAIYTDVDMVVLRPLSELFALEMGGKMALSISHKLCVMLIDCSAPGWKQPWWPTLERIRREYRDIADYRKLIHDHDGFGTMPGDWNEMRDLKPTTAIYHYTDMRTQPWRPYPDHFKYNKPHVCQAAVKLWQRMEVESLADGPATG